MNISYLMSIVNLYLKKETQDKNVHLSISKELHEKIKFSITTSNNLSDQTTFSLPYEMVMDPVNLNDLINTYKNNNIIIDEKQEYDAIRENCFYETLFNNGRVLSLYHFTVIEINNIRNILYNISYNPSTIRLNLDEKKPIVSVNYNVLKLGESGFTGVVTLFLIAIWFLDIFVLSLWIFKSFL